MPGGRHRRPARPAWQRPRRHVAPRRAGSYPRPRPSAAQPGAPLRSPHLRQRRQELLSTLGSRSPRSEPPPPASRARREEPEERSRRRERGDGAD